MIVKFALQQFKCFVGATDGLSQSTARVVLAWDGTPGQVQGVQDQGVIQRLRWACDGLNLQEPQFGTHSDGLPQALLCPDDHVRRSAHAMSADLAGWVVALSVLLQRWAHDAVGCGRVVDVAAGTWQLAVPYQREAVVRQALTRALKLVLLGQRDMTLSALAQDAAWRRWQQETRDWLEQARPGGMDTLSQRFALAALTHGMPVSETQGFLRLGQGVNSLRVLGSFSDQSSAVASNLARNKVATSVVLQAQAIAVPQAVVVASWEAAQQVPQRLGWPLVVKPSNQDMGRGVVTGIRDAQQLQAAYQEAARLSPKAVVVQQHVPGDDFRVLVVRGEMLMATRRTPGHVVGDGRQTVRALLDALNRDPRRGKHSRSLMLQIPLDEEALGCLSEQGLDPDAIPHAGQRVTLRRTANIATGGTAEDVTADVHPDNRRLCERAARVVGLDIAGVDFICPDIRRSWKEVGGAILEVNAQPGFRPHWLGDPRRDLHAEIIHKLYGGRPSRIPTAAITGTNGKTTVTRMLHRIWQLAGYRVGRCETSGVWLGDECLSTQNLSGYPGARMLLENPEVEAAVFEMPRKGLLAFGHPCDRYDVAALINVADEHVGIDGIDSVEDLAALKAQVLSRAAHAVVVNVDDPVCRRVAERHFEAQGSSVAGVTRRRWIAVSRHEADPWLQAHLGQGGRAVLVGHHDGGPWIMLSDAQQRVPLMALSNVALCWGGLLSVHVTNALCAVALAWGQGLELDAIQRGLREFGSRAQDNPGRYQRLHFNGVQVLLDYAHNPHGVQPLCEVVNTLEVSGERRLVAFNIANRHRRHMEVLAPLLVASFDEWVLGAGWQSVSRSKDWQDPSDPENRHCMQRVQEVLLQSMHSAGADPLRLRWMDDADAACDWAWRACRAGDLLVVLADPEVLDRLQARLRTEMADEEAKGATMIQGVGGE